MATQLYLPLKVDLGDFRAVLYSRDWGMERMAIHGKTKDEAIAKAQAQIPDLERMFGDGVHISRVQQLFLVSGVAKYETIADFT